MNEPRFDEFAWAVGIIEGEGCIRLVRASDHVGKNNYLRITVQMTDEDTILRLRDALGRGTITNRAPFTASRQQTWIWDVSGSPAYHLLYRLLPHLGRRRQARALECLEAIGAIDENQMEIA